MKMRFVKFVALPAVALLGLILLANRVRLRLLFDELRAPSLPQEVSAAAQPSKSSVIPSEYNLAVPFAPQAPFANWGLPYQEACEEAALIMAARFFANQKLSAKEMNDEIKKLVAWEKKRFGYYEDTTAAEVAIVAREYFKLNAQVDYDLSVANIKKHIAQNHLVLVPAAGRVLPNPYFRRPGPLYHMLVIRGYTKDRFITNDPGTKRGKGFLYKYQDLLGAVHDWPASAKATAGRPNKTGGSAPTPSRIKARPALDAGYGTGSNPPSPSAKAMGDRSGRGGTTTEQDMLKGKAVMIMVSK